MTQLSFPWPDQDPDVGDGRSYTANEWDNFWEAVFTQYNSDTEGVLYGVWNELEVSSPGDNDIEVETGFAIVAGKKYSNDAEISLSPDSADSGDTRKDSVILQCDWDGSGQTEQYTVRAVIKEGSSSNYPSLTQTNNSLWEIEIARYIIDDSGAISDLSDRRTYCHFATKVSTDMLEDHSALHEDGGSQEISVEGLAGDLADEQDAKAHDLAGAEHNADTLADLNAKVSDATLDDSGDSRDPNAHKASHQDGGADEIDVTDLSGRLADDQPADTLGGQSPDTGNAANTIMQRDANARSQVADPSAAQDIATKNYVDALAATGLPSGIIVIWSGAIADIPDGWVLCNGGSDTPNLEDKFVVGAGDSYAVGDTGGSNNVDLRHRHQAYHNTGSSNINTGLTDAALGADFSVATQGHGHNINDYTGYALDTNQENRPPYYALAFIMRE